MTLPVVKPSVLHKYQNSVENLRSHHWKYWIDLYSNCHFDCLYCVYRESGPMGEVSAHPERIDALKHELGELTGPGIVYLGPQSDVYQPLEKQQRITRAALEVFLETETPVFTVTRSAMVLRDASILRELAAKGLVEVSITIASPQVIKSIEPRTMSVEQRLELVKELKSLGIPTSVHMSPILPHIDTVNSLFDLMDRCGESLADCIYACVLGVTGNYFEALSQSLIEHNRDVGECFVKEYETPVNGTVGSANGEFVLRIMKKLSEHATTRGLPFSSAHIPILDNCERNGGIFRYKLPTVGDIVRSCARRGINRIDHSTLEAIVSQYPAVDDDYLESLKLFWNQGTLFQNTYFHRSGDEFVLSNILDKAISNMRVTAARETELKI